MFEQTPFLRRLHEEAMAALMAEPTPYMRREMFKLGWTFRQSAPYTDYRGQEIAGCVQIYDPAGKLAYSCDGDAIPADQPYRQNFIGYDQMRRQVLNRLNFF